MYYEKNIFCYPERGCDPLTRNRLLFPKRE